LGFSNWPVIFASSTNANKLSGTIIKFSGALLGTKVEEAPHQLGPIKFSGAVAEEEEDFCEGSFRTHILYFV
jgi:hypothetical protein